MKRVSFCSSFKALLIDTSFIKIGVCYHMYQKLSTLEFNFHTGTLATAYKGCLVAEL